MTPGQCPPENTPLVSSVDELAADKALIDEWKDKAGESFPGRDASFDEKLKWYHSFNDSAWDDFMAGAPAPEEFLPKVLLDACDDSVELQLIMKRSHAKKLNDMDNEDKVKFMASSERARGEPLRQRVLNKARSTEKGLAAYVEWLENGAPGCELRPSAVPQPTRFQPDISFDEVVVASTTLAKGDCAESAIARLIRNTGLYGTVSAPHVTSDWSVFAHNTGMGKDKIGEYLFYVNKHGKCCVALELHLACLGNPRMSAAVEGKPAKEPAKSAAFRDECTRLSVVHADKTCITIGEDEEDEDDEAPDKPTEWPDEESSEEEESGDDMERPPVQAIWLPKFYNNERERVFAHIHDGEGEALDILGCILGTQDPSWRPS